MKEIESWADREAFNSPLELPLGNRRGVVGPGRKALAHAGLSPPESIQSMVVALIGEDPIKPDAIFIGHRSFEGVMVFRNSERRAQYFRDDKKSYLSKSNDRVACICRDKDM